MGAIFLLFTLFYPFLLFFTPLEWRNLIFQLYWILLCTLLIKSFPMICHTCISKKFDKCWKWWGEGDFWPPQKGGARQNWVWPSINYCFLSLKDHLCQFSCLYRNIAAYALPGYRNNPSSRNNSPLDIIIRLQVLIDQKMQIQKERL